MKVPFPNLNILGTRYDSRKNAKEQFSCISIVIPSKTESLGKKKQKQYEDTIGISLDYWCANLR